MELTILALTGIVKFYVEYTLNLSLDNWEDGWIQDVQ